MVQTCGVQKHKEHKGTKTFFVRLHLLRLSRGSLLFAQPSSFTRKCMEGSS